MTLLFDRTGAGVVRVTGADARGFLDDMISQRIGGLEPGQGVHSLLLQPTGKVEVDFRILCATGPHAETDGATDGATGGEPGGEVWWMLTEVDYGARLAETLLRFRIRVAVEVDDESDAWSVLALRDDAGADGAGGGSADRVVEQVFGAVPDLHPFRHVDPGDIPASAAGGARLVRSDWPGGGIDVLVRREAAAGIAAAIEAAGAERGDDDRYEALRIRSGIPRLGLDVDEGTIPQEALLEHTAVDFDKGCFLGQELVCRIRDRGRVTRFLRRLAVDGPVPPPGAELVVGDDAVGTVTSATATGGPPIALGYLRARVEPGDRVEVRWPDGSASATVEELVPAGR